MSAYIHVQETNTYILPAGVLVLVIPGLRGNHGGQLLLEIDHAFPLHPYAQYKHTYIGSGRDRPDSGEIGKPDLTTG